MPLAPGAAMTSAYRHIDDRLKAGEVVILDGGIGSELQAVGYPENPADRPKNYTWGSLALHEAPEKLVEVQRRYVVDHFGVLTHELPSIPRVRSLIARPHPIRPPPSLHPTPPPPHRRRPW